MQCTDSEALAHLSWFFPSQHITLHSVPDKIHCATAHAYQNSILVYIEIYDTKHPTIVFILLRTDLCIRGPANLLYRTIQERINYRGSNQTAPIANY